MIVFLFLWLFFFMSTANAEPVDVAVFKTKFIDFGKFIDTDNMIFYRKGNRVDSKDRISKFIIEKINNMKHFTNDNLPTSSNFTVIDNNVAPNSYRLSGKKFAVNRSIDLMLCHTPEVFKDNVSFKCDHMVFEFYQSEALDATPIYEFVWDKLLNSRPSESKTTFAFGPPEIYTINMQLKS